MPVIKVTDIAYGRLGAPDLDQAETFLTDFGMVRAARTHNALYMRGTDPVHHIHITELGEPRFIALGFHAANEDDLKRVAKLDGASGVEPVDEPGGGLRVRLRDPHGHRVEIVWGVETPAPLPVRRAVVNWGEERLRRKGELMRLARGPSQVKRIGHGVLMTPDLRKTLGWYRETLGLIASDDVYAGAPDNVIASFNRCDRGEDYVDHHTFFAFQGERAGLNHLSYEVRDFDDVMLGHEHLRAKGYNHQWGVGRHILGSQVFDYWADPWGRVHEHWTDTDVLNARQAPNLLPAEVAFGSQWGEPAPETLLNTATSSA